MSTSATASRSPGAGARSRYPAGSSMPGAYSARPGPRPVVLPTRMLTSGLRRWRNELRHRRASSCLGRACGATRRNLAHHGTRCRGARRGQAVAAHRSGQGWVCQAAYGWRQPRQHVSRHSQYQPADQITVKITYTTRRDVTPPSNRN
jgi:hypothetical protein